MSRSARNLIIDGQVFQTPAWHRGMGKYSLELVSAVDKLNSEIHVWRKVVLILSNKFSTEDSFIEKLSIKAPNIEIVSLGLNPNEYDNRMAANKNRKVINTYIESICSDKQEEQIDFLVLSLMQSEIAPAFPTQSYVTNHLLLYDLIPLMFHKTYLTNPLNQKSYLSKLAELLRADNYLAISKTVANDLAYTLGINPNRIASIDGAPIEHADNPSPVNVPTPFILMPTGNDLRKNNRRGIKAFDKFNKMHNEKYTLVITSTFKQHEIDEYTKICSRVVFTGNISGGELDYLYEKTQILLFPTEYEGLGLPILEAVEKSKPVACSDISVFKEISEDAFYYFDPRSETSIVKALNKAITSSKLPLKEYRKILDKFTWDRTANLLVESIRDSAKDNQQHPAPLTVFAPDPRSSQAGVRFQQLYSEMQKIFDLRIYFDVGDSLDRGFNYLGQITTTVDVSSPTSIVLDNENLPLYFIDETSSSSILLIALANPGIVVLESPDLKQLWMRSAKRHLIHRSRINLEEELNKKYEDSNYLVSLIASQRLIIVRDKNTYRNLERLLKKVSLRVPPEVALLTAFKPALVYPDLKISTSLIDYPPSEINNLNSSTSDKFIGALSQHMRILLGKNNE